MEIATGRSGYSILFLLIYGIVAPTAVFTEWPWLDEVAWFLTIVLGFFILVTGLVTLKEGKESVHWPEVEATLKSVALTWRSHKSSKSYAPKIKCVFQVSGREYEGTEYDFSSSYTSRRKAEEKVAEVKAMKPLLIRYHPEKPELNVLNPGIRAVHYMRIMIGIGAMVIALLSWVGVITYR